MRMIDIPEYRIFRGIIARCENPNVRAYRFYGAKGVSVSPVWREDFWAFYNHIGPRPSPAHSVDRIDSAKGYEPENVRWTTMIVQQNNRVNTRYITINRRKMTLYDACRLFGSPLHPQTVWGRLTRGWSIDNAMFTPQLPKGTTERKVAA